MGYNGLTNLFVKSSIWALFFALALSAFSAYAQTIPPSVLTGDVTNLSGSSVTLEGTVDPNGSLDTKRWFEWGPSTSFGNSTAKAAQVTAGDFTISIAGLQSSKTYYYRAVAENSHGTVLGSTKSFTTGSVTSGTYAPPLVSTLPPTNVTDESVIIRGFVDPFGVSGTQRWIEWGTSPISFSNETTKRGHGFSMGWFSEEITNLNPNQTYYARAAAQNGNGTRYGHAVEFTTKQEQTQNTFPNNTNNSNTTSNITTTPSGSQSLVATTLFVSRLSRNSATLQGNAFSDSNSQSIAWFEWGLSPTLGINTAAQSLGPIKGQNFEQNLFALLPNTTYYFRAVVQNNLGTHRGDTRTFTTALKPTPAPAPRSGGGFTTEVGDFELKANVINKSFPNGTDTLTVAHTGHSLEFSISVKNVGETPIGNLVITNTIPDFLEFQTGSSQAHFNSVENSVTWTIKRILPGQSAVLTFIGKVLPLPENAIVTSHAQGTVGQKEDRSNDVTILLNTSPITLSISSPQETVNAEEITKFEVRYKNEGEAPIQNTQLSLVLPEGIEYTGLISGEKPSVKKNVILFNLTTLDPEAEGSVEVQTVTRAGLNKGAKLTTTAVLEYTDVFSQKQSDVTTYFTHTVDTTKAPSDSASAGTASLLGVGFLPNTLVGWLTLTVLVIALLLLLRQARRSLNKKGGPRLEDEILEEVVEMPDHKPDPEINLIQPPSA